MTYEPDAPKQAPSYVIDPLKRQGSDLLEKIGRYCFDLAEYKRHESYDDLEDTPLDEEQQEKLVEEGGPVEQEEMVRCGKNCAGCPHGPYVYKYEWKEGKVVSTYVGSVDAT